MAAAAILRLGSTAGSHAVSPRPAIVLKKDAFRERDRRYTLFGRGHGLIVAVARGGSMPASKRRLGNWNRFALPK